MKREGMNDTETLFDHRISIQSAAEQTVTGAHLPSPTQVCLFPDLLLMLPWVSLSLRLYSSSVFVSLSCLVVLCQLEFDVFLVEPIVHCFHYLKALAVSGCTLVRMLTKGGIWTLTSHVAYRHSNLDVHFGVLVARSRDSLKFSCLLELGGGYETRQSPLRLARMRLS